jgi:quercetin dioxygenase-like cupin family protein
MRAKPETGLGEERMEVRRFDDAKAYEAPNHRDYVSYRLFGAEAGGPSQFTVVCSHFLPGGGAGPDSSANEKVYVCIAGEITIIAGGRTAILRPNDSVYLEPNEKREIANRSHQPASIVAVMNVLPK